jgi:hypothetical protein
LTTRIIILLELGIRKASLDVGGVSFRCKMHHAELCPTLGALLFLEMVLSSMSNDNAARSSNLETLGSGFTGLQLASSAAIGTLNVKTYCGDCLLLLLLESYQFRGGNNSIDL